MEKRAVDIYLWTPCIGIMIVRLPVMNSIYWCHVLSDLSSLNEWGVSLFCVLGKDVEHQTSFHTE